VGSLTLYVITGARLTKVELVDQKCSESRFPNHAVFARQPMIIQSIRLAYRGSNKVASLKISTEHVSKRTGLLTQGSELEVSEPIAHIISGENKYAITKFCCNEIVDGFNGR
jgi:hypothetical protein